VHKQAKVEGLPIWKGRLSESDWDKGFVREAYTAGRGSTGREIKGLIGVEKTEGPRGPKVKGREDEGGKQAL